MHFPGLGASQFSRADGSQLSASGLAATAISQFGDANDRKLSPLNARGPLGGSDPSLFGDHASGRQSAVMPPLRPIGSGSPFPSPSPFSPRPMGLPGSPTTKVDAAQRRGSPLMGVPLQRTLAERTGAGRQRASPLSPYRT